IAGTYNHGVIARLGIATREAKLRSRTGDRIDGAGRFLQTQPGRHSNHRSGLDWSERLAPRLTRIDRRRACRWRWSRPLRRRIWECLHSTTPFSTGLFALEELGKR